MEGKEWKYVKNSGQGPDAKGGKWKSYVVKAVDWKTNKDIMPDNNKRIDK